MNTVSFTSLLRTLGRPVLPALFLVAILTLPTLAQPGLPGAPQQSPIDGGLALLALAGTGYAVRKLRRNGKCKSGF